MRLDIEAVSNNSDLCGALLRVMQAERPLGGTLQVLDSRGCYIQSLSLRSAFRNVNRWKVFTGTDDYCRTRSQPRVQQVLPAYPNVVTSSHVELYAVPYGAAGVIEHEPLVSDVAPRPRST